MRLILLLLSLSALGLTAQGLRSPAFVAQLQRPAAAAGSCPADGSPNESQAGTTAFLNINSDAPYAGQLFTTPSAITLCKVRFHLTTLNTGSNITARVYSLSGTTITPASPLGESDVQVSDIGWSLTDVIFTFSTPIALSSATDYAIVLTSNGGVGTGSAVRVHKNGSGTLAGREGGWLSGGTMYDPNAGDCAMALYWY